MKPMNLTKLFYPESIAVVGASPNVILGKLNFYKQLRAFGYRGRLYPINPAHKEIDGVKVYPSMDALPETVDLAIVQVNARLALQVLEVGVRKGVKFLHFFTSGFSEIGHSDREEA